MFQAENFPEYENECMNILKLGIWGKKTFLEFKIDRNYEWKTSQKMK